MKRIIYIALVSLLCFQATGVMAQRKIESVGQLSDQQLIQLWQQTQKQGMSESDAMKELVKRGMSVSDVAEFKRRLVRLQASDRKMFGKDNLITDTAYFLRDSTWKYELPDIRIPSPYYGFDFFNNPQASFIPNVNMATPANYVLGPGDEIIVNITGLNEVSHRERVTREGNFELPHAGFVQVSGLTIEQATTRIRTKLKLPYPALASGQSQLLVTLGNVRSIRVTVIGEADRPGDYTISSLAGFFNVLYLSGGPGKNGSLRSIELIRNNKVIKTVDFYQFLQSGLMDTEIRLQDRDIIRYPLYNKRVVLSGAVRRPSVYELLEKETLADLLRFAGGWADMAFKGSLKVSQVGNQERLFRDVPETDFSYFIPRNADSVFVDKVRERFLNRVIIAGSVVRPGNYELVEGLSLLRLIQKANGLTEDAFVNRGYIKRQAPGTTEPLLVSFNVAELLAGKATDIPLFREDSVVIQSRNDLISQMSITVGGNVRNPGTIAFRKGMTLEDAILLAGGFTNDAATHKVEVSRLQKNNADTLANRLLTLFTVKVDSSLDTDKTAIQLEPLDYIFVPKLLNYQLPGSVKLRGEILYAGDYALERRDETVTEMLQRAGGISPYASMRDIQVFRNNLRVASDVFSAGERFVLLPNDSIYIPRSTSFVEVKGAVFNPQILSYGNGSLKSYIADAGGVTDNGNLKKAYVQYSNGISRKTKKFLFFRSYPKVLPGSKIVVPERSATERRGLSIIEISSLTGTLTALISLIAVLRN
ncbi:SLBB domain-containing protein [Sediminibacterium sp. KACHI17]|jgi:protein involved in polysaccharide export with SLBB domain